MILHVSPPYALVDGPAHFFPQWRGNDLRLFGPLSIQAKLLHSPEQALAKLWVELPQDNPKCVAVISKAVRLRPGLLHAIEKGNIYTQTHISNLDICLVDCSFCIFLLLQALAHFRGRFPQPYPQEEDVGFQITPEALQQLRSWCDWMLAEFLEGTSEGGGGRDLAEAAGRRYASVYALKLKGQAYDEVVLSKMEASASVRWLAKWRLESHLQISSKEEAASSTSSQWRSWIDWAKGTNQSETTETAGPKQAWAESEGFSMEALLNELPQAEELPELATPTRFELHMQISQYTALCDASGLDVQVVCVAVRTFQ